MTTLETWLLDQCRFIKDNTGTNNYYFKLADGVIKRMTVSKQEPTRKQIEAIMRGVYDVNRLIENDPFDGLCMQEDFDWTK